jgi:murein DD-endopeptidase MepM/ murein hydrolase activator NlpD
MYRNDDRMFAFVIMAIVILMITFFVTNIRADDFTPPLRDYIVTSDFGFRRPVMGGEDEDLLHRGLDLAPVGKDRQVYAAAPGVVTTHFPPPSRVYRGHPILGGMIVIHHADGACTMYGHMSQTFVHEGQTVGRGQVIGIVGATGRATGPHVHFEILYDPARVLIDSSALINRRNFERKQLLK